MAESAGRPRAEGEAAGPARNRRHYYRVTTRLRFRVIMGSVPPEVWLHREGGEGSSFYRPEPQTLERARALLAAVPRRSINLSEGGMRVRFPEEEPDRSLLEGGSRFRQRRVHILMAFGEPEEEGYQVFQLPAHLVRLDKLPWARFVAFEFYAVPEGLRQRLEGQVLAIERRRLRRNLLAYGSPEAGDDMAERLRRLEAGQQQRRAEQERQPLRHLRRRNRFFP
jgi:hypothetical protein